MNKKELSTAIAAKSADIKSATEAGRIVDTLLDVITAELVAKGEVEFYSFGKFSTSEQAAKEGVIPGSKPPKKYKSPAKTIGKFKFSKTLQEKIANK